MAELTSKEIAVSQPGTPWIAAVVLAWLVPGAGHFFLGRKVRAILVFSTVLLMFVLGLMMRGAFFEPQSGDLLTMVIYYGGFIAHLASGTPYFLSVALGYDQPDVAGHVYDYGAKFLVAAGLLNILAIVDACDIAIRRKN